MTTTSTSRFLAALLIGGLMLVSPGQSLADKGQCGQPTSTGATVKTSDALSILKEAVQQVTDCDPKLCICDVNSSGGINTTDALLVLKKAVAQPVTLTCTTGPCGPTGLACTSTKITTRAGSDLDSGWTGIAHNSDIIQGAVITARVKRSCSTTISQECQHDDDCPGSETCVPSCNCKDDVRW